jgi:oxalate decarboxylase/phosphoglucose isomerase-like protein (cupin superfamily)
MKKFQIPIIDDFKLYEVGRLELVGQNGDRKFAPNIDNGGNVHLNILEPGARSGNHYHKVVQEFFVNAGPEKLLLHLLDPASGRIETIEMLPISLTDAKAYRPKHKIPHMVENSSNMPLTLIIIVDRDNPDDTYRFDVL